MVGVGGRSGACHTCRRRRVKCDETQPACQRCVKAKFHCEGYARALTFVDEKQRAQKRVQVKRKAYLENLKAEEERDRAARFERVATKGTLVNKELSLGIFRDQISISFTLRRLFMGKPWVTIGYRDEENDTSTQTMKALSSVFFGRVHHQQESLDLGMDHYSKALRLLAVDLRDPKGSSSLSSLVNVLSLGLFEVMASSAGAGVIQHLGGVQKLVQFFGPERFQKQPELSVFETSRTAMLHSFTERRVRCFLEEHEWQTVPWLKHPEAKTLHSRLNDRLCHIPGILGDLENLQTCTSPSPKEAGDLCRKLYLHIYELYVWRSAWESQHPSCCFDADISDPNVPYRKSLHFNMLPRAFEIALYNTILFLLCRIGRILMGSKFSTTTPAATISTVRTNTPLLLPSDSKSIYDIAMEIIRLMDYGMHDRHQNAGHFPLLFPLRVVLEIFPEGCKEQIYLRQIFDKIADIGGFEMARRMGPTGLSGRLLVRGDTLHSIPTPDPTASPGSAHESPEQSRLATRLKVV